jgi:hypothetical protein
MEFQPSDPLPIAVLSGAAQPAAVADAAARPEIVAFLSVRCTQPFARSIDAAQLSGNPLGRTFKACARTEAASLIFRCLPISLLAIYLPPIDLITI